MNGKSTETKMTTQIKNIFGQTLEEKNLAIRLMLSFVGGFALVMSILLLAASFSYAGTNTYASPVDGAAPLTPDGNNEVVLTVTASAGGGGNTVNSFDLIFSGSVVASDVAEVIVNQNGALYGSTTALGSWPNINITGGAKPKNAVEVIVRLNASAGGKTVGVTIQNENPYSGGAGLPLSTSGNLAITAAATPDQLSVTSSSAVASAATPSQTNVQMVYLQLDCSNSDDGACDVDSVTVDDLGNVGAGDIDNMEIHFDNDADFGNGTLGSIDNFSWDGTSTVVDTSTLGAARTVSFGGSKYLWIIYDLSAAADTKDIRASVTDIAVGGIDTFDNTGNPWNSSTITVSAGASNQLTTCGDCHTYPPSDTAVQRNNPTGAVFGSHATHLAINGVGCATCHVSPTPEDNTNFDHRSGTIEMQNPITTSGSYSKGASFAQSNDLDGTGLGTCNNIDCHFSQPTPQWGSAAGTNCESCHNNGAGEPWPTAGAHDAHFAAFGVSAIDSTDSALVISWCTICHTGAGSGTSKHADGNLYDVSIDSLYDDQSSGTPSYSGGANGTCSNISCHGGNVSLTWNDPTGIDIGTECTFCHKAEATPTEYNSPTSGMHAITTTVSGRHHVNDSTNPTIACLDCHVGAPNDHYYDAPASNVRSNLNLDTTATDTVVNADMSPANGTITIGATPAQTTCAMTCHLDNATNQSDGPWPRLNDKTKASASDGSECDTCHGGVNGIDSWTFIKQADAHNTSDGKVEHFYSWDGDGSAEVPTSHSGCKTCHGWNKGDVNANYTETWSTGDHGDGNITMNGEAGYDQNNWNCTAACHAGAANNNHNLENSNWTVNLGNFGAGGDCIGCHGDNSGKPDIPTEPVSDFGLSHSHISNAVTADDCAVCHHSSQPMDGTGDSTIILRNADDDSAIPYTQGDGDNAALIAFCLSCHDANGATASFNVTDGGTALQPFSTQSGNVPNMAQYWTNTTASSHDYPNTDQSGAFNTVPQLTKARSAHGFPDTNELKQDYNAPSSQTGYDNANPVGCLNCHPAHGSNNGSPQVTDGQVAYFASLGDKMVVTGYSEPNTCWNCHDSSNVEDYYGDNTVGGHWTGTQKSEFAYKQRSYVSQHNVNNDAQILCSVCHNPHGASAGPKYNTPHLRDTWMTSPWFEDRICDLGGSQQPITYTSGSHSAGNHQGPRVEPTFEYNKAPQYGHGYGASGGTGQDGYYLDENTFGFTGASGLTKGITGGGGFNAGDIIVSRIAETVQDFAGLCKRCHDGASGTGAWNADFRDNLMGSVARTDFNSSSIHQTVKGWAGADGSSTNYVNASNNPFMHQYGSPFVNDFRVIRDKDYYDPRPGYGWGASPAQGNQMADNTVAYHQFACSKCHTPHASSLPRQMITNCLDVGDPVDDPQENSQRAAHGSAPAFSYPTWGATGWDTGDTFGPDTSNISELAMHCHNKRSTNTNGGDGWNQVTGW